LAGNRTIVLPGDIVDLGGLKPRNGLFKSGENEYSSEYFGLVQSGEEFVDIVSFSGAYMPRRNDKVVGKVIEIGPSMWIIDINSPYTSLMHMNDTPWRVNPGELKRYLHVGDYVYAKVMTLNEIKESWLTLKDVGLRLLEGGSVISIPPPKVPRIIGKGGAMVNLVKDSTKTRIMVGQNGLIWIDGKEEDVLVASEALHLVSNEAHTTGLTDRVAEFLKSKVGDTGGN
jgi:exosome complex component RRP4